MALSLQMGVRLGMLTEQRLRKGKSKYPLIESRGLSNAASVFASGHC